MKKIYSLLLLFVASFSFGQTIYSENMGTPTGTTLIPAYSTGTAPATFQNSTPIVYSGSGDVRATSASNTYSGASGGGNVYLAATAGKYFQIDGINTSAYTSANIQMSFGYLTALFATVQVVVEYSTNASTATPTWTAIPFTNNTSASWALVSIPGGILPSSSTLSLRFSEGAILGQIRIDDVKVINFNPACTFVFGAPTTACDAVTPAIDTYTATIPYTGAGGGGYTVTSTSGSVGGDNPNTVVAGNIIVSNITEGTSVTLNVTKGVCIYSLTVTGPDCKIVNTLPFADSFPYAVGSSLGASQNWQNINSGDNIIASAGSLNYTGFTSSGNSETFSGAGIDCFTPYTDTTTGTIYASFIMNVTDMTNVTGATASTYFASLTSATQAYKSRLFLNKTGATTYQFGLDGASTTTNLDTTTRNVGDVIFVVMGYDFSNSTISAWINPNLSTFNATTPPTLSQVQTTPIADLGGFIFRQDAAGTTPTMIVDELRISTTTAQLLSVNQNNAITGLKVYPNPVSNGTLFITSDSNSEKSIVIFDVLGKQVLNTKTATSSVNVSGLNAGIYLVKITEEGNTAVRKIVIQ